MVKNASLIFIGVALIGVGMVVADNGGFFGVVFGIITAGTLLVMFSMFSRGRWSGREDYAGRPTIAAYLPNGDYKVISQVSQYFIVVDDRYYKDEDSEPILIHRSELPHEVPLTFSVKDGIVGITSTGGD